MDTLFDLPEVDTPRVDVGKLADDLTLRVMRHDHACRAAHYNGKRSRATINIDAVAQEHGIQREAVDYAAGMGIFATLEGGYNVVRAAVVAALAQYGIMEAA